MNSNEQIEIKLSKVKLVMMLVGCIAFVAAGILFVAGPERFKSTVASNTTIIFVAGWAGIIFFGTVAVFIVKKITDKSPGLVISNTGIIDNSSGVSAGFIAWKDVIAIKETSVANQKFICMVVKNPQFYIDKQKSLFKRKLMQANNNLYGSAIQISANGLKITFEELKKVLQKKLDEFAAS